VDNKEKKYNYIYRTTNLINKKYYIGMHSTDNLNDGYIGSGVKLLRSIKKYGKENFKCEILEMLLDRGSLKKREIELVNEDILKDKMCLNLMCGGEGGFISEEQQRYRSQCGGKIHSEKMKNNVAYREQVINTASKTFKKLHSMGKIRYDTFKDKKHTKETKQKMSKSSKGIGIGESNSQFGTCWITNGIENKKIKKNEILPDKWVLGRVIKK
jgi:hypothetical protein